MSEFTIAELRTSVVVGFAEDRSPAWHHAGTDVNELIAQQIAYPGAIPVERVREFVGWTARTEDISMLVTRNDLDMLTLPEGVNLRGVIRVNGDGTKQLLAVNGGAYATRGPGETIMPMVEELTDMGCEVATAMSLRGRYIATSIRIPEGAEVELAGLGSARLVVNATDSTDGSLPTTWHTSLVIIVCDNTARMSLSRAHLTYMLRHTTNRSFSAGDAMEAIDLTIKNGEAWADHFNRMAEIRFSDEDLARFLDSAIPIEDMEAGRGLTIRENKRNEITRLWHNDPRVTPLTGTMAGAYQCMSTFDQWSSTARGSKNPHMRFAKAMRPTLSFDMTDQLTDWLAASERQLVSA